MNKGKGTVNTNSLSGGGTEVWRKKTRILFSLRETLLIR